MGDRDTGMIDVAGAFVMGALLGAALALFLAPQSGEKTRKHLGKKGRKWKKEGEEWLGETEERIGEWTQKITEAVESGVETIRETVDEQLKDLEKKLGKKGLF